jgi:hypothetical protein
LQSLRSRLFKEEARNKGCQEEDDVNAAFFAKKQEISSQKSTQPSAARPHSHLLAFHHSNQSDIRPVVDEDSEKENATNVVKIIIGIASVG